MTAAGSRHEQSSTHMFRSAGHNKEALEAFKECLMKTNSYMRVDLSVCYFRMLLIGNLGCEMSSGTGKAAEVMDCVFAMAFLVDLQIRDRDITTESEFYVP